MSGFDEQNTVQSWLVDRLVSLGWEHVPGELVPRERTDPIVEEWVLEALDVLNPELQGFPERVDEVLPLIRQAVMSAASDGLLSANERMTALLRGNHTVNGLGMLLHQGRPAWRDWFGIEVQVTSELRRLIEATI